MGESRFILENAVELVNPPDRLLLSIFSCLSWPPIWCPENADVVQPQGARCAGMAHAISSFVQRRTPQAGRSCVFQVYGGDEEQVRTDVTICPWWRFPVILGQWLIQHRVATHVPDLATLSGNLKTAFSSSPA